MQSRTWSQAVLSTCCTLVRMVAMARACSCLNLPAYVAESAYCGFEDMYLQILIKCQHPIWHLPVHVAVRARYFSQGIIVKCASGMGIAGAGICRARQQCRACINCCESYGCSVLQYITERIQDGVKYAAEL